MIQGDKIHLQFILCFWVCIFLKFNCSVNKQGLISLRPDFLSCINKNSSFISYRLLYPCASSVTNRPMYSIFEIWQYFNISSFIEKLKSVLYIDLISFSSDITYRWDYIISHHLFSFLDFFWISMSQSSPTPYILEWFYSSRLYINEINFTFW